MNWENVRCFIEAAKHRSMTAAAEELGMSVATLGRRIDTLEANLELKLLHRSPTGVVLSENGRLVLEYAKSGAEHFHGIERAAVALKNNRRSSPIRISSTETVLSEILAPRVPDLLADEPNLLVDLVVSNENVNLNKREADIAVRLGRPDSPGLIARRLAELKLGLFASSQYLDGRAANEIDLQAERILGYDNNFGDIPEVQWMENQNLTKNIVVVSSSSYTLLNATCAGTGIAMLPQFLADNRGLIRIPTAPIPSREPWLIYHRDMKNLIDIKRTNKWIVETFDSILSSDAMMV